MIIWHKTTPWIVCIIQGVVYEVGAPGFEPGTSRTRTVHSRRAELRPGCLRDFTIDLRSDLPPLFPFRYISKIIKSVLELGL